MRVVLLTRDSQHVADVDMPPFEPMPEIVAWGLRSFVARPAASWADPAAPEYGEAFAYYVPAIVDGAPVRDTPARVQALPEFGTVGVVSAPVHVVTDPAQVDRTLGPDGQQRTYLVMTADERAKGFVRPVRHSYKHVGGKACGTVTQMGHAIAETYARDPKFYGATFCVGCKTHLPVSEFVWDWNGATERVGS